VDGSPLTSHALAWSCDAELAVGVNDSVMVCLPDTPTSGLDKAQFSTSIRFATSKKPDPRLNTDLFAAVGADLPYNVLDEDFHGAGTGLVGGSGSANGQVVALEWSPSGVGHNLRPVLGVLLTTGVLMVYGEKIARASMVGLAERNRSLTSWRILWGIGVNLPLPNYQPTDSDTRKHVTSMDRIKSLAWAKEVAPGAALLAYATDSDDVVILSVQYAAAVPDAAVDFDWRVEEVSRFSSVGPHAKRNVSVINGISWQLACTNMTKIMDPDYMPSGSAFSLKWSPWLTSESSRTATLAYLAPSYVGFRRITIHGDWERGTAPNIEIGAADSVGICAHLSTDAFVEWENAVSPSISSNYSTLLIVGSDLDSEQPQSVPWCHRNPLPSKAVPSRA
jgi:hypothetical protein